MVCQEVCSEERCLDVGDNKLPDEVATGYLNGDGTVVERFNITAIGCNVCDVAGTSRI